MNITIINDCLDANASGRQITRATSLLGGPISFIGVANDLEAGGNLVDALDAIDGRAGVVLVNVAPRGGVAKKWKNGTPFGYFWHKSTLVIASIDGFTLSLVKKLHLIDFINIVDISIAINILTEDVPISSNRKRHIINSQFRSYDFLPRLAAFLLKHKHVASTRLDISKIISAPLTIWWIDNFGNCKTTLLLRDIASRKDGLVTTNLGPLHFYSRLKDVPDKRAALIVGSSGLGDGRFLEIVIQGASAAQYLGLSSGDAIF